MVETIMPLRHGFSDRALPLAHPSPSSARGGAIVCESNLNMAVANVKQFNK
ncbi:hypothetical protein H6F86_08115 [Phormidium sp. FACHB-592]|uniref:Uncharacterized protein n=1 Tax=Stenomitos frigidus AS-A4 TaxID=2933935 RepID=A0ABV0KH30_9CYAN|nr:hypothetical protein [Phormidium sp. FACHB-592]MBD2073852.1 hypothetical protein [Phormidium sp. FACHB-592]